MDRVGVAEGAVRARSQRAAGRRRVAPATRLSVKLSRTSSGESTDEVLVIVTVQLIESPTFDNSSQTFASSTSGWKSSVSQVSSTMTSG